MKDFDIYKLGSILIIFGVVCIIFSICYYAFSAGFVQGILCLGFITGGIGISIILFDDYWIMLSEKNRKDLKKNRFFYDTILDASVYNYPEPPHKVTVVTPSVNIQSRNNIDELVERRDVFIKGALFGIKLAERYYGLKDNSAFNNLLIND